MSGLYANDAARVEQLERKVAELEERIEQIVAPRPVASSRAEYVRALRLRKLLAGICRDCTLPSLDGSAFCEKHLDARRAAGRKWNNTTRKRQAEARRGA